MNIKPGHKGDVVSAIQEKLRLEASGIFDSRTEAAVKTFQRNKGLNVDGIVGPITAGSLGIDLEAYLTTDIRDTTLTTTQGLLIHKFYLDEGQYIEGPTDKFYVFLHHTAGPHNPYATIRTWNNDDRGRIATQFVIGNRSAEGDTTYDGLVVECFPDEGWAYHLGKNNSALLHPHAIGIEICNFGWLEKRGGRFYTYVNRELPGDQVIDLGFRFRGYRYYHKYSDAQIESVNQLLQEISRRHAEVNLHVGLCEWLKTQDIADAFDFKQDACDGNIRGLLTHTNTRMDKSDCSPQPMLIDMIRDLC